VATLSVALPTFGAEPAGGWSDILALARVLDSAGVDRVVVSDHVVLGPHTDEYPWGRFPVPPEAPWLEALTVLTAIAAVTDRIRLSTGILVGPVRPATVLAKTVATLDVLSGGRVDLGVGTGWQRDELTSAGVEFDQRGQALTDTIGACRALWEQAPASFRSTTVSFDDLWCRPAPAQRRLPVWFSGVLHRRNVRRIVELGDGWLPIMGATPDDIRAGVALLHGELRAAGRDPEALTVRGSPRVQAPAEAGRAERIAALVATVPELLAAGVTDINVNMRALGIGPDEAAAAVPELVERFAAVRAAAASIERP
jgi:probable F420-dependent oxidoreductase